MENYELVTLRNSEIKKSNLLIQQSRHQFTVQQQKILLLLISQLDPDQTSFDWQTFDIPEFCRVCGIEAQQGRTYKYVKDAVLDIRNKGFWVKVGGEEDKDREVIMSWIRQAEILPNNGKIAIKLDDQMKPYLLELREKFTQYQLKYALAMRSKYAVRLYELLKSYENKKKGQTDVDFSLDWFKIRVGVDYERWVDIRRFVIDTAIKEINVVSDIFVTYETMKRGRAVAGVKFLIESKKDWDSQVAAERAVFDRLKGKRKKSIEQPIPGQMSLEDAEIANVKEEPLEAPTLSDEEERIALERKSLEEEITRDVMGPTTESPEERGFFSRLFGRK